MKGPLGPGVQGQQGVWRRNILHSAASTTAWQAEEQQKTASLLWSLVFSRWVPLELGRDVSEDCGQNPLKAVEVGEEDNAVDRRNMSMICTGSNWKVN